MGSEWALGPLWEGEADDEKVRVEVIGSADGEPYPIVSAWQQYPSGKWGWLATDDDSDYFINWQVAGTLARELRDLRAAALAYHEASEELADATDREVSARDANNGRASRGAVDRSKAAIVRHREAEARLLALLPAPPAQEPQP